MISTSSGVLFGIFLILGYVLMLICVFHKNVNPRIVPIVIGLTLMIYAGFIGILGVIFFVTRSIGVTIFTMIIMLGLFGAALGIRYMLYHKEEINVRVFLILIIYFFAVMAITILLRQGEKQYYVNMQLFSELASAIRHHSLADLNHSLLNVFLFIPFGFLIPALIDRKINCIFVILFSAFLSASIESTQLILHLGMCDIDDILANVLGAVVGIMIYHAFGNIIRDWI